MRNLVRESSSPLGNLVDLISPQTTKPFFEKVASGISEKKEMASERSVLEKQRNIPEPVSISDAASHIIFLNDKADVARRNFLKWQSSPEMQKKSYSKRITSELREVKILIMDALDERVDFNRGQIDFLKGLKEEMNRLMKILKAS
jgi:hypothetical protein